MTGSRNPAAAEGRPRGRVSRSSFRVRYGETDQMGLAYHANYLVWCEIGRTDFMRELGSSYAELERDGLLLAVAEAHIRYHASAYYDEVVHVETWIERAQSRSITFGYRVLRTDDDGETRLATASTRLIALDRDGRLRRLPDELRARFRAVVDGDG